MKYAFKKIKTYIAPFLNWRILIIYLPIWFIMSGWTYLFIYLGAKHGVGWMLAAGTFWATVLWLPITPEKLITIPLTLLIYIRWRGHSDDKLEALIGEAKQDWDKTKTHLVTIYRKTCRWFKRNYSRLVKTMIILLVTMILLFVAGLLA